jgi:4-hydroxy-tetrahydrodipicolinate synthase
MKPYTGAWPVMVTPYDKKLKIDYGVYQTMIVWYLDHGVGGLYANCLSSEMYLLDDDERLALVAEAVKAADGRVPVAATGNLGNTFDDHVAFCRRIADTLKTMKENIPIRQSFHREMMSISPIPGTANVSYFGR